MRLVASSIAKLALITTASLANGTQSCPSAAFAQARQQAAQTPAAKQIGTIKAINGNTIMLTTQSGGELSVLVQDSTRMVRVEPGDTSLANAAPLQLTELQPGDRVIVRGQPSGQAKSFIASGIIAMKHEDLEAKRKSQLDDWKKRGIGGVVASADATTASITISTATLGVAKTVAVHATKDTILRRYSPDSVKFDDAKPSTFNQIKPGDQLIARGMRSSDGAECAAEEIVSGVFRNIAGIISAIDATANTATVTDSITQKQVFVKVTAESQIRKLPPEMAQRIAMRIRGEQPAGSAGANGPGGGGAATRSQAQPGGIGPGPGGRPGGGPPDIQQIMNRLPPAALADLQKGDAVMLLSSEGTQAGKVTAIKLLAGVEAILAAAPKGAQPMALSPWNLGTGGEVGGDAGP